MAENNIRRRCQFISEAAVFFIFKALDFLLKRLQNISSGLLAAGLSDNFTFTRIQRLLFVGQNNIYRTASGDPIKSLRCRRADFSPQCVAIEIQQSAGKHGTILDKLYIDSLA